MSLEAQIAALVTAANNLTSAVNGKMTEIDAAVDAAVKAIPNMSKDYFVDAVSGVDTALGTSAAPLKTIGEAMSRTATTPYAVIYLMAGQTHEYSGPSNMMPYRLVSNKLTFAKYGSGNDPVFAPKVGNYFSSYSNIHFFVMEGGTVLFKNVKLVMPNTLLDGTTAWGNQGFGAGLFHRAHGTNNSLQGSVTFASCTIQLGAVDVFYSGYAGNFRCDLTYCTIDAALTSKFAKLDGSTLTLAVFATTVSNSKTWGNLISGVVKAANGSVTNVVSNVGDVIAGAA